MAKKCNTAFVDPPVAIISDTAFSMASRVTISRGFKSALTAAISTFAESRAESVFSASGLAIVDEPSKLMPSASNDDDIVLAVYIPPQDPLPGIALRSMP